MQCNVTRRESKRRIVGWFVLLGWLLPCMALAESAAPADGYRILASIRPIALLAQELSAGLPVQVSTLVPAGATTHDYALSPADLARLRTAQLVVWLGSPGEPYLRKVMTRQPNDLRWGEQPGLLQLPLRAALHDDHAGHEDHSNQDHASHEDHGQESKADAADNHGHSGFDPHLWWSAANALVLARALEQRISRDRPQWSATLQQNRAALETRLHQQLNEQRRHFAAGYKPFLLAHDAFFYLEEDLGIASEAALVLDPENRPGLKHLLELKQRVAQQNIGCVLTGALVPDSLIDKIDGQPPLLRLSIDELGWDYSGERYSDWLALTYGKVMECAGLSVD